jgi:6-phosphogluconolactonase
MLFSSSRHRFAFATLGATVTCVLLACAGESGEPGPVAPSPTGSPTTDGSSEASASDAQSPEDAAFDASTGPNVDAKSDAITPSAPLTMLVGSGDGVVRAFAVDEATGAVTPRGEIRTGGSPSFLAVKKNPARVYGVDESRDRVFSYSFNPVQGTFAQLGQPRPSGGRGPTHLSLDAKAEHVLVANYTEGNFAVFALEPDGSIGNVRGTQASGEKSHIALTNPSGGFAYVASLGTDRIAQYKYMQGALIPLSPTAAVLPAGGGPRHLAFRDDEKFAYSVNELTSSVTTFQFDVSTGQLSPRATLSALPAGFMGANTGAEIFVHPTGRFVYSSNRGHDSIAMFASDQATGALTALGHVKTEGRTPRSFAVDPDGAWLVAANQKSDTLKLYRINVQTGVLMPIGGTVTAPSPTFVGLYRL